MNIRRTFRLPFKRVTRGYGTYVSGIIYVLDATHLYSCFAQVQSHGEFFSGEHVRVLSFLESSFQLVQLVRGEGRSTSPDLSRFHLGQIVTRLSFIRVDGQV